MSLASLAEVSIPAVLVEAALLVELVETLAEFPEFLEAFAI